MKLSRENVLPIIKAALKEDIGSGDITTEPLFKEEAPFVKGHIFAKSTGIIAGLDIAKWTFEELGRRVKFISLVRDGRYVKRFQRLAIIKGPAGLVLKGERTALNFLAHLSGIATLTNLFVKKISGTKAKIFDTRKTTPILRYLEKYAVRVGGGYNHRMGLWDGVLIKDNHIDSYRPQTTDHRPQTIKDVITIMKEKGYKRIEIEVKDLKEFKAALESGADIIMLDNMKLSDIKKAVQIRNNLCLKSQVSSLKSLIEISGGVSLQNVRNIAKTGVDMISVGSLTHSAPPLDLSLKIEL